MEQRVESYYPRAGVDEGGGVRRHPHNASMVTVYAPAGRTVEQRVESYYPRTGVDEGGSVRRHRIPRRWILSTHRREGQRNNESKVTIHAPAWTRVVVCAGTPHNASMVTVYAPAGTTVEQRVENYYQRTGVDEGGNVRRHAA